MASRTGAVSWSMTPDTPPRSLHSSASDQRLHHDGTREHGRSAQPTEARPVPTPGLGGAEDDNPTGSAAGHRSADLASPPRFGPVSGNGRRVSVGPSPHQRGAQVF